MRRLSGSEAVVRGVGVNRVWQDGVQIPPNEILEKDIKWPSGETIAGRITLRAGSARPDYQRLVELIVEKANLEWFQGSLGGRALPPMAVKPEAAKSLRA